MRVKNCIAECDDGVPRPRVLHRITKVIVHRIDRSVGTNAASIAAAFRDKTKYAAGSYTGGEMPYAIIVLDDGTLEQALSLSDVGPHARKYNAEAVGVAVVGDFRSAKPSSLQWQSLVEACAWLTTWIGGAVQHTVYGHTELDGSSEDPGKECPGSLLDMYELRRDVHQHMRRYAQDYLVNVAGMHF